MGRALVDSEDRADTLGQRLAQHGLGLHADTLDDIHHHESSISNSQRGGDLAGEIDVTRRVDEVDQVIVTVTLALKGFEVLVLHLVVEGDSGGLDGDTTLLLVRPCVGKASIAGLRFNIARVQLQHRGLMRGWTLPSALTRVPESY